MTSPQSVKAKTEPPAHSRWIILRRRDQTAVALLVVGAMIWCGIWWLKNGGFSGNLTNVERDHEENDSRRSVPYLVDINTADVAELGELPQVGPNLARRMIEHRERHGPFRTFDDLLRVKGIGPKTLEALRPHVRFD